MTQNGVDGAGPARRLRVSTLTFALMVTIGCGVGTRVSVGEGWMVSVGSGLAVAVAVGGIFVAWVLPTVVGSGVGVEDRRLTEQQPIEKLEVFAVISSFSPYEN